MFDFWYARTQYRRYRQINALVSQTEGQICSGIPGQEYVVCDQDGGRVVIDLAAASSVQSFAVHWFDPVSGREQPGTEIAAGGLGGRRTLTSPFEADSVLLLKGMMKVD